MTTRFSIWQQQIILHWDYSLPPGVKEEALVRCMKDEFVSQEEYVDHRGDVRRRKALFPEPPGFETPLWDKLDPEKMDGVPEAIWPALAGYAKWNKKCNGFFLSLGKQNLQRLREQFGANVMVDKGQMRIESLRADLKRFNAGVAKAIEILNAPELPPIDVKKPPLAEYQHRGVIYLSEVQAAPLFADCGCGKTYMVLVSTQLQIQRGALPRGKTLICAKLNTIETGWLADTGKFTDLKIASLWLPPGKKKKEKVRELLESDADVFVINHDGVRVFEKELAAKRFQKVVLDESTIMKSYRGSRGKGGAFGKSLMAVAEGARWRVVMSGTPASNGAHDLWGQYKFLDPHGFLLEPSFYDFRNRYMEEIVFGKKDDPNAPSTWRMTELGTKEVGDLIRPAAFRVRLRDHLKDFPELTIMRRKAPMGPEQTKHYKEMLKSFATTIDSEFVSVTIKLAQIQKLRQITGGFLVDELKAHHEVPDCPKWEMLDSLVEEEISSDEKIVIFAQHRWEIEKIAERYKDHGVVTVYGENSSSQNLENIRRFIQEPLPRIIVLQPKAAAHGINFTCAHYMIFYSVSYSAEDDYQCVKRIDRAGQKNAMFVYYLLARDSVDETIYDVVQAKNETQANLIDPPTGGDDVAIDEIWRRLRAQMQRTGRNGRGADAKGAVHSGSDRAAVR